MKLLRIFGLIFVFLLLAFSPVQKSEAAKAEAEYQKLLKLEQKALRYPGKAFTYDLTGKKSCNKTTIKYLGIAHTQKGKYKILTSFFVYSTHIDMCHGTSFIKIYNMQNRKIGSYYVGSADNLPDYLAENKLRYASNSKECNLRKTRIIDLNRGLPKQFFIPCTENGGDLYRFSD